MKRICYVDGSGNTYTLTLEGKKAKVKYEPMTPETSSSGFYSGGEPFEKEMTDDELFNQIARIAMHAIRSSDRISKRVMGSGLLIIEDANSKREAILASNSRIKEKLEELLRKIDPEKP
ncbi:MAG: hypothetical protein QW566_05535 [Candidatus Jordarchaeales archaeon]